MVDFDNGTYILPNIWYSFAPSIFADSSNDDGIDSKNALKIIILNVS